jgi:hypothetical protein
MVGYNVLGGSSIYQPLRALLLPMNRDKYGSPEKVASRAIDR